MRRGRRSRPDTGRTGVSAGAATPTAARMTPASLADVRLWLGMLLLVGCVVGGTAAFSSRDDTVTVWRAERDLSAGAPLTDVSPVEVSRQVADRYVGPGDDLAGVLRWPVAAGELVPVSAVSHGPTAPSRSVTVPVDPLHAPPTIQVGDRVDVWATAGEPADGSASDSPVAVLTGATVVGVWPEASGMSGDLGVVLDVPIGEVAAVVAATRRGAIDLVAVPPSSQESTT